MLFRYWRVLDGEARCTVGLTASYYFRVSTKLIEGGESASLGLKFAEAQWGLYNRRTVTPVGEINSSNGYIE